MLAVFNREVKSYFRGIIGYVFIAFLLLFIGLYVVSINFNAQMANFEYALSGVSFIYLISVPLLTMRVFAEEKHQKTDQLLYSLPLSMTEVVLGKFLAMLAVLLLPVIIVCFYPLILTAYGAVQLSIAYSTLFAFFLLGAALVSIGMFISSITENQIIAVVLSLIVMLINYFLATLATQFVSGTAASSLAALAVTILILGLIMLLLTKNLLASAGLALILELAVIIVYIFSPSSLEGLFPTIMTSLSLFDRFYQFINTGVFDLTSLIYFLTVAGVFIFLTVQVLEKRRWN